MKQSISLKLSHTEVTGLEFITWNVSASLLRDKHTLYRLAGWQLHKLHHRLHQKTTVTFAGKKSIRLNVADMLALHAFILKECVPLDIYTDTLRNEIFMQLDQLL